MGGTDREESELMAFLRPTLTEIIDRVLADLSRFVGVTGAVLRRSVLGILGRALAGASHELHGRLDYIARQVIIDTADGDVLRRWANVWDVQPKAAEFASGRVTLTGSNGSVIPAGTVLQRQDGALYETTADAVIVIATATASVVAQEAGAAGNVAAGVALTLSQPVAGIQSAATVAAGGISGGSDAETDDELRARLLARIQEPPHGGAARDYVAWALEVPGVTRAWVYPQEMGPGTVTVRFVRDNDPDLIPDSGEVATVYAYIEDLRPVTAELFVVPPIAAPLDFEIQLNPDTVAVRAAVQAELTDLLRREAEPGGTVLISRVREAVSTAAGESDNVVVSPAANVVRAPGEITVPGSFTFSGLA